ncbi:MAG: glycosyltransferase family 92 protein [Paracoccaceae bacterium]
MKFFSRLFHPITRIAITPPPAAKGRAGLAIVLIVKNEARHIAEWARFHHGAGVARFFVYDNACTDGTIEVLRATLPGDALTVIPWAQPRFRTTRGREIHNQVLAYAHALMNFGPAFRWMAFIDVDEFLVPVEANSIPDAMEGLEGAAHVSLPWHMFGRGGHDSPPEGGVVSNYLQRAADPFGLSHGLNFKCLVDPARVTEVGVHGFAIDGRHEGVNDAGEPAPHASRSERRFYSRARLQLNHYYTRSNAELQAKIGRGSNKSVEADRHIARVMRIVSTIEAETVEDRTALAFLQRCPAATD